MISDQKHIFGDFQTPLSFCKKAVSLIKEKYSLNPHILVEPTIGVGNFCKAGIECFECLNQIIGIDINEEYIKQDKEIFKAIPISQSFVSANSFSIDYHQFKLGYQENILFLGNPPWVTNSDLTTAGGVNVPQKSNTIRMGRGFDAISGKSNFDIAESILLHLFDSFRSYKNVTFAFLIKSIVARNLLRDAEKNAFPFDFFDIYYFDAHKVFNVSVDAVLLVAGFRGIKTSISQGSVYELENPFVLTRRFGYSGTFFVSDINSFNSCKDIAGESQKEWRQGIKHDCSKVMELSLDDSSGKLMNNLKEDCSCLTNCTRLYPLVKSSEIKGGVIKSYKHFLIVTQDYVGEDTSFLKKDHDLWEYLNNHLSFFQKRKSVIYKSAQPFSIFGVGEYSFKRYKIAISGLYKGPRFSFLMADKPVMTDDTCYFIGSDDFAEACFLFCLLDSSWTYSYLKSISFSDSKRPFTKDVLQTVDLAKLYEKNGRQFVKSKMYSEFGCTCDDAMCDKLLASLCSNIQTNLNL